MTDGQEEGRPLTAFALVSLAGLSTALGAAVVCIPNIVQYATEKALAMALAFSAGVMTYVSFVEIFHKSAGSFQDAGFSEGIAFTLATVCFFGGIAVVFLIDKLVHYIMGDSHADGGVQVGIQAGACPAGVCVSDLANVMRDLELKAAEMGLETWGEDTTSSNVTKTEAKKQKRARKGASKQAPESPKDEEGDKRKLMLMSMKTALALALHNFPEGLATFMASVKDPKLGAVLSIAIAIHNIPEGLCVALPVYFASKSKWKAFGWALLSGVSEPLAALLGWVVLARHFGDTLFATMFGMVGGMMVIISMRELMPTAHKYDKDDVVVTKSFCAGMALIAASLVLFVVY